MIFGQTKFIIEDGSDNVMAEEIMYTPYVDTHNYSFFSLKLVIEKFEHST